MYFLFLLKKNALAHTQEILIRTLRKELFGIKIDGTILENNIQLIQYRYF